MKTDALSNKLTVTTCALLAALAGEAKIVHTPAAAIAANYQTGTNPAVDANGGIWSFHQRFWWNDPNKGDLSTPHTVTATSGEQLVGYYGIKEGSGQEPYVIVNPTDHDLYVPAMAANQTDRPIHAGEVVMHPYHFSSTVPHRSVLRFTTPRTGFYSFSALVRSMNNKFWETSKRTDITVLVNNVIYHREELIRPGDNVTYPDLGPITFDHKLLPQGTTIDLVVGCGFLEGGNLGYQGDGVAIDLKITEEDETATDLIDKTWHLNTAFWNESRQATPSSSFNDPTSGSWAFYETRNGPFFYEYQTQAALMGFWTTLTNAPGPKVSVSSGSEPHIHVYNPTSTDSADSGLYNGAQLVDAAILDRIAPGELTMHTGNPDKNLMVRFTVPEDGRYLASFLLRDVSADPSVNNARQHGVWAFILAGSSLLSQDYLSCDVGHPIDEFVAFRQTRTPLLKAGQVIDFMLYNNSGYNWDGTAGSYTIMKLKDAKDTNTFYAAEAFRANLAGPKSNPYTDADGCTWSVGKCTTPGADFTRFTVTQQGKQLSGWHDQNTAQYKELPTLMFNPNDTAIVGAKDTSDIQPGHTLFPNEFYLHPNQNMYGVLRFQAPRDGVYSVHATARDIHAGNIDSDPGVRCTLVAPGFYLGSATACCDNKNGGGTFPFCWANLYADDIYLRAGETLDLAVGVNGTRQTNCDATGVYEELHVAEDETPAFVSVDLRNTAGTAAAPYTLRPRAGWADLLWNPTTFDATAQALTATDIRSTAAYRTSTGFSLVHTAEPLDGTAQALGVNTLLNDGVVSTNTTDTFTFTFNGLPPNESFKLYLYGATVTGAGVPTFAANGKTATPSLAWSRATAQDVAVLKAVSDADGVLSGSFYNSTTNSTVIFCGVQLAGATLLDYVPHGTLLIVR